MRLIYIILKTIDWTKWMKNERVWPPEDMIAWEWEPETLWEPKPITSDPIGFPIVGRWHETNGLRIRNWVARILRDALTTLENEPLVWEKMLNTLLREMQKTTPAEDSILGGFERSDLDWILEDLKAEESLLAWAFYRCRHIEPYQYYENLKTPVYIADLFEHATFALTYMQILVLIFVVLWNVDQIRPFTVADYSPAMRNCYYLLLGGSLSLWFVSYLHPRGSCDTYVAYLLVQSYSIGILLWVIFSFPLLGLYFVYRTVSRTEASNKYDKGTYLLAPTPDRATIFTRAGDSELYEPERIKDVTVPRVITTPPQKRLDVLDKRYKKKAIEWALGNVRRKKTEVTRRLKKDLRRRFKIEWARWRD